MNCAIDEFVDILLDELRSKNSNNKVVLNTIKELETIKVNGLQFAVKPGDELNEVFVSKEELADIKSKNNEYRNANPDKFINGDEFSFDPDSGIITTIQVSDDNDIDEAMYEVYTAHEIRHAVTYAWLKENQDGDEFKYLLIGIDKAARILDPGRDPMKNLLLDRLKYANDSKTDLSKVAEVVAILSSEPNIRKAFMEEFPQETQTKLAKILDVIKKFLGAHDIDLSAMISTVDSIVEKDEINETDNLILGSDKAFISNDQAYQKLQLDKIEKLENRTIEAEDNLASRLRGTIKIYQNHRAKQFVNYKIDKLKINKDDESVTIRMVRGKDTKTYTFPFGKSESNETAKSKKTVVAGDNLHLMTKDLGLQLKSQDDVEFDFSEYYSLENEVHGNIEGMQRLLEELHLAGGEKETSEHLEYLKGLIGEMDQGFFESMDTFINDTADKTGGVITGSNIGIQVSKGAKTARNQMSEAEVYAHEIIHAMSMFALSDGDSRESRRIRKELEHVMNVAMDNLTWEDLMPEESIDKAEETKIAKEMFEYIFNGKKAEDEFIAHVLTNPIVMEKMKNIRLIEEKNEMSLYEKILDMFADLMNILSGNYKFKEKNNTLYEQTKQLAFALGEINRKSIRKAKDNETLGQRIWNGMQDYNFGSGEALEDFYQMNIVGKVKYEDRPPKSAGLLAQVKWITKTIGLFLLNDDYNKAFEMILSAYGFKPEGTIQSIIRDFKKPDDFANEVDMLALQADKIDQAKLTLVTAQHASITEAFSKQLTVEEESALTRVLLDADLSSIWDKYTTRQIRTMLEDEAKLDTMIGRAKNRLKELDKKNYDWNTTQATLLGHYIATHKGTIAMNLNADSIARGIMSSERRGKPSKELIGTIDEVATLVGLKFTGRKNKQLVRELMRTETVGIKTLINKHNSFKKESAKYLFDGVESLMIKGYSRELFDDKISMMIAPISEENELAKQGYVLKKELEKSSYDANKTPVGVYIADAYETSNYYRTATRLTSLGSKGTTLSEVRYKTDGEIGGVRAEMDKLRMDKERMRIIESMENGTYDMKNAEYGMLPVIDTDGFVINYRYTMDKEAKEQFLGQKVEIGEVLSRSFSHSLDKAQTAIQNQKVLDLLMRDMKENYNGTTYGNNGKEYITISQNSTNKEISELYKILPSKFKHVIQQSKDKKIAVRRDMIHNFFGYRHLSIIDFPLLKKITPMVMQRLIIITEKMWIEFVKIVKANILIKMPVVIIGNIISNFVFSVLRGTDPFTLIKMYIESTRDVRSYLKKHRELIDLEIAEKSGNLQNKDLRKIEKLKRELKNNKSVHELVELGIYQAIVEDISRSETAHSNKLKQFVKEKTDGTPSIIKNGANMLYLTEETGYYKFMSEVLQMSDLVARDIENRVMKKKQEQQVRGEKPLPRWFVMKDKLKGAKYKSERRRLTGEEKKKFNEMATKIRHQTILDSFINYNKPSSALEEYFNRVGAIMFTKYAKRIQRVIGKTFAENPLNSLALILGESFVGDVETIYDQSFLNRSWYNLGLSGGDMMPGTNPFERIMDAFNPPAVALLTESRVWH